MMARAEELTAIENAFLESFKVEINHRCDEKRDELGNHQTAYYNQAERTPG